MFELTKMLYRTSGKTNYKEIFEQIFPSDILPHVRKVSVTILLTMCNEISVSRKPIN